MQDAAKGNRSFNSCPFKLLLPIISNIGDTQFNLQIDLVRKSSEKSYELILEYVLFEDRHHHKHLVHIKHLNLSSQKNTLHAVLKIPIARNQIALRNATFKITILSLEYKYEITYILDSKLKVSLAGVLKLEADKKDIEVFNEFSHNHKNEKDTTEKSKNSSLSARSDHIPAIKEYRNAVFREMYYLKENGGRKYKVTNGRYIDQNDGYFSYAFELDAELHLSDDAPITISIPGITAKGFVTVCDGFQLFISVDKDLGEKVSSAMISVEPWKLLEALGNRLDSLNGSNKIAIKLAEEGPKLITKKSGEYIPKGQDNAIEHVENNDITVIWGPPGTGKTYTMSLIALMAMRRGKRVLIVSHSNISVDGVIKATADRLREYGMPNELKNGEVLRYGYVRDDQLADDPYIVAFNYALQSLSEEQKRMKKLKQEKESLSDEDKYSVKRKNIENELRQIRSKVREKEKQYVANAKIVATTISKVLTDSIFDDKKYDLVMFDEVSMAYVPQIIIAASYASQKFVCVGDFRQLAPIAQSDARRILCTDIFTYLGINQHGRIHAHPWMVMLNEQRRMHPAISAFPNKYVYDGLLVDHESMKHARDTIAARNPVPGYALQMIDLSGTFCASTKNIDNSRFNILSAIIAFGTALRSKRSGEQSIGIITPYAAQARLVRAMLKDYSGKELPSISCATVHQFQGSERNVVIFDAVESYPSSKAGVLLSNNENGDVTRLINVAITRARGKFITIGNSKFWEMKFKNSSNIYYELIQYLRDNGLVTRNNKNNNLQSYIDSLDYGKKIHIYTEEYKIDYQLKKDIILAQNKIIVSLPDGKREYNDPILKLLKDAKESGIQVLCKASNYSGLPNDWKEISCESENAVFPLISIDDKIIWYGLPSFKGKFTDGAWGFLTVLPLVFRLTGEHTVNLIKSLSDIDYIEKNGKRSVLKEKHEITASDKESIGTNGSDEESGLAEFIYENVKCSKCGNSTELKYGHKSGKAYLKCPSCGNLDYITADEVNEYIDSNHIVCPKHHCHIHASLGKYGVYVRCNAGHYIRLSEL